MQKKAGLYQRKAYLYIENNIFKVYMKRKNVSKRIKNKFVGKCS